MYPSPGYRILLDGYNIIKQHPQWSKQPLETARRQLVSTAGSMKWPFPLDSIKVVFDGKNNEPSQYKTVSKVVVCYVPDADTEIQKDIRALYNHCRLALVSNDRELQHTAKSHKVSVYTVSWFLKQASSDSRVKSRQLRPDPEGAEKTSAVAARRITEELSKYWLKDREK